jgi:hypothetical protein
MQPLHARTSAEAHLYMVIHPCGNCGDAEFDTTVGVALAGADLVTGYRGPCRSCKAEREFQFRIDDEPPPSTVEPTFGAAAPSTIIDAGQWLGCADRILEATPNTVLGVPVEEWRARRFLFATAAESVGEVLKFIPDGADGVPPQGFWTEEGRAVRDRAPERFRRAALERMRLACLDLTATYAS